MSKSIPMALSIVLAQLFAVSVYAQVKGEVDPAETKGAVVKKASPMEKAEAKAARKAEGAAAAKSEKPPTVTEGEAGKRPAVAKVSPEEKAAARAKRKAAAAEAAKKGETVKGEVSTVK